MTSRAGGGESADAAPAAAAASDDSCPVMYMQPVLLADDEGNSHVSEGMAHICRQIEWFTATAADAEARNKKGGPTKVLPGSVGLRCVHCAHLPLERQANGASTFPRSIGLTHQAVRNWQRYHLPKCQEMPEEVRTTYQGLKKHSGGGRATKGHWEDSCRRRGLYDAIVAIDGKETKTIEVIRYRDVGVAGGVGFIPGSEHACTVATIDDEVGADGNVLHNGALGDGELEDLLGSLGVVDQLAGSALPSNSSRTGKRSPAPFTGDYSANNSVAMMSQEDLSREDRARMRELADMLANDTFAMSSRGSVTVKDWISGEMVRAMSLHGNQVHKADQHYQLKAVRLALSLLEKVQLCHQNSTAFGGSTISSGTLCVFLDGTEAADNNIVGTGSPYSVGITGVASPSPLSTSTFEDDVRVDLINVGAVLYELFSGVPPFQNQEEAALFDALAAAVMTEEECDDGPTKKKREMTTSPNGDCIPLRDLGLPLAIDALVKDLMGDSKNKTESHQKEIGDFICDIQQMINDPDRCLFDIETGESRYQWAQDGHRLEFPTGKLYGRDRDMALLSSVFDRTICKNGPVEAVAVSGYSGIGKTSLVHQFRQPTIERGGFFISGKFDTLRQAKPLSAIANALDAFCDDLVSKPLSFANAIQQDIRSAIGDDCDAMSRLIPNLRKIIPEKSDKNTMCQGQRASQGGVNDDGSIGIEIDTKAMGRLKYIFCKFFHVVASPSHPVVLFIDDLQWADQMSLDLIQSILCERDASSLLFIGCYRSNEVDQDHPLLSRLENICTAGVPMLRLEISNMDKNSINALVSDTLKLSPLLTRPLTDAVYAKTSGNCLFVIELLSDLHRQALLRYSVSSLRWEWDYEAIAALDIQANVVDLMRRKLLRLAAIEMWSVKVAACLGAETKGSTLDLLSSGLGLTPESGLVALLRRPVEEGLLTKVGSSYRFSHDQIQHAAYSLVTVGDRPLFHLKLGRSLLIAAMPVEEVDADALFTCVDQLNRGSTEITGHSEKLQVAKLNLHASKRSIASSAFLTASTYLKKSIELLDEIDWQSSYDLCLEVFTTLSETEYATGSYGGMTIVLNELLTRAKTFDDKLQAYYTLMCATAAQNNLESAIDIGFNILQQLDEPMRKEVDLDLVMKEMKSTGEMLKMKDQKWFLGHRLMSDHHKLFAMKFMNKLALYAFMFNGLLVPMVSCKMIQTTVRHGLCKESSYAFATYSCTVCGFLQEYDYGYQLGKISIAVLDKFNAQDVLARISYVIYSFVNTWVEPIQATFPKLLEGYIVGMSCGDPESALLCKRVSTVSASQCGQPLADLVNEVIDLSEDCKRYQQEFIDIMNKPLWQWAQNLIGGPEGDGEADPWILRGTIQTEDDYVAVKRERGNLVAICQYSLLQLILAFIFKRYELAAESVDKCIEANLETNLVGKFDISTCSFYSALTAFEMLKVSPNDRKWSGIVSSALIKLEKWASVSSWNFEHRLSFLKAEQMANEGDNDNAAMAYENAASQAKAHGFVNEEALARERYAAFLRTTGKGTSARDQYDKAHSAYMKWGALRKCSELQADGCL